MQPADVASVIWRVGRGVTGLNVVQSEPQLKTVQTIEVRRVDPVRDPKWIEFVCSHPDATIYHHPAWLTCLSLEYGRTPEGYLAESGDGRVTGVLPLLATEGFPLLRKTQLAGRRLSSLPRTPVAGPLARDSATKKALVEAAVDRLQELPGTRLEIKGMSRDLDQIVPGLRSLPWRDSYRLELPDSPEKLRFGNSRNHGRIRWAVNKASKQGVVVRPAEDLADLRAWYGLYLETMRWHAIPPRSFRFFEGLWQVLAPAGLMRLLLAEHLSLGSKRLLAGSILLMFGGTVFYAFNGRKSEDLSLRPNDIIQWSAIHDACAEGFRRYDFGEVAEDHEGLAKFKSKWGIEPTRLYRSYYPAPDHIQTGARFGQGPISRSVHAVWRMMPLDITAIAGDQIYRYL